MVPLDRALVSSYRLSIVTMSLSAAVWPQFATQVFGGVARSLRCIASYVSNHLCVHNCWCSGETKVRSGSPSDSWALAYVGISYRALVVTMLAPQST